MTVCECEWLQLSLFFTSFLEMINSGVPYTSIYHCSSIIMIILCKHGVVGPTYIYIWTSLYWTINSFFVSNTISFYSCTDKGGMYDKGVSPLSSTKTCLKKKYFFGHFCLWKGWNLQNILF